MRTVYLDHAATTPLAPEVLEVMMPFLREQYGNPSSVHALGRRARFAVEDARERLAVVLGCEPGDLLFTSGGTEADNAALRGVLTAADRRGPGLVTSSVEHEAVLQPAHALAAAGHPVAILDPAPHGAVEPGQVEEAISSSTGLVSLMLINNELGSVSRIGAVAEICRAAGVPLHTDAVQAAGVMRLGVDALGVDLLSLSAHKAYGPKGVGLLYVRPGTPFEPLVRGGAQERRRRGGTENVAGVVGMAEALEIAAAAAETEAARVGTIRDRLAEELRRRFGEGIRFNSPLRGHAAPHILNVSFPPVDDRPVDGEMLLLGLDLAGVMVSSGSACASGAVEPSHVLRAIGLPGRTARATVRFSLGRSTTAEDVEYVVAQLAAVVERGRAA